MSTQNNKKNDIDQIIVRMINAAGVKNPAQLTTFLGKSRSMVNGWKNRGEISKDIIELVSLKTGYRKEWLLTGELPEKQVREVVPTVQEEFGTFVPGVRFDNAPLSKREKNELSILRWLEANKPIYRQRISDEITEIYILATTEQERE